MDNLECSECGVTYYSAAAADMVIRGERCDCGGRLTEREGRRTARVTAHGETDARTSDPRTQPDPDTGRRFDRPTE